MKKALTQITAILPIMVGMVMMVNLVMPLVMEKYKILFSGNMLADAVLGALAGSISFGNPVTSYMVGRDLLDHGVAIAPVTAFMVAWATVGMVAVPLEASLFGRRFAVVRNITNLLFSFLIAIATDLFLNTF